MRSATPSTPNSRREPAVAGPGSGGYTAGKPWRIRMRALALTTLLLASACKQAPPEAPKELVDLSFYLFSEFEAEDDVVVDASVVVVVASSATPMTIRTSPPESIV